ncbi:unnamed protein product [Prorocentrum cordatum]|uniref:Uncharacterized protein n=1 Tax=Prorocentrum cordatum TaxID=2364126 RepID=A0ABN9WCB7_9DINO|nr:unnamed protein product [Polarella glacialis]
MPGSSEHSAQSSPRGGKPKVPLEPLTPEEATWQAAVLGIFAVVCLSAVFWTCVTAYGKWVALFVVAAIAANVVAAAPAVLGTFRAEALRNLRAAMARGDQQSIQTAILWAQAAGVSIEEASSSEELRAALRGKLRAAVEAGDRRRASAVVRCVRAAEARHEGGAQGQRNAGPRCPASGLTGSALGAPASGPRDSVGCPSAPGPVGAPRGAWAPGPRGARASLRGRGGALRRRGRGGEGRPGQALPGPPGATASSGVRGAAARRRRGCGVVRHRPRASPRRARRPGPGDQQQLDRAVSPAQRRRRGVRCVQLRAYPLPCIRGRFFLL